MHSTFCQLVSQVTLNPLSVLVLYEWLDTTYPHTPETLFTFPVPVLSQYISIMYITHQTQPPQQQQQMPMSAGAWPQQGQQFGMGGNMASGGNNLMGIPDRSSATPAPMGQQSPTVQQTSANDFSDLMKW